MRYFRRILEDHKKYFTRTNFREIYDIYFREGSFFILCFRQALLSLDLSFNYIEDLTDVLSLLRQLPTLRNLLLQGNPVFVRVIWYPWTLSIVEFLEKYP